MSLFCIGGVALFFLHRATFFFSQGGSMLPTIGRFAIVGVDQAPTMERGMIVVFTPTEEWNSSGRYIKRVVGLPNDLIHAENHIVRVTSDEGTQEFEVLSNVYFEGAVPEGHLFVVGDNHWNSNDSLSQLSRGGDYIFVPMENVASYGHISWQIPILK